jgi:hypothetical protein
MEREVLMKTAIWNNETNENIYAKKINTLKKSIFVIKLNNPK